MPLHDYIRCVHDWNLDVGQFEVHLTGESIVYSDDEQTLREEPGIEYQMSARLIKNLQILASLDPGRPILIHMKTMGGDWNEGMAIYNAIRQAVNPIIILNRTHARSMSSIILQAARKRVMMPNTYFMFHEGTLSASDTYKGFMSFAEWSKKENPVMLETYAQRMKQKGVFSQKPKTEIKEMLQEFMNKKQEKYLTAKQTVDWGLADEIFDGDWTKLRVGLVK